MVATLQGLKKREANPKAEAKANIYTMIDEPSPFATLETWEQHLKEMQNLPDNVEQKRDLIASAEDCIARKQSSIKVLGKDEFEFRRTTQSLEACIDQTVHALQPYGVTRADVDAVVRQALQQKANTK
jgi:hypothetical protein